VSRAEGGSTAAVEAQPSAPGGGPGAPPPSDLLAQLATADADAALRLLRTDRRGLSGAEAARRLQEYGPNEVRPEQRSLGGIVLEQARSGINILLALAGVVTLAIGDVPDGAIILVLVVLNVGLSIVQEYRAERALAALRALLPLECRVRRDGAPRVRPASDLVPGDVVAVRTGDMVPADLRLLEASGLEVNQATLTGESVPQVKEVAPAPPGPPAGWTDVLFAGTTVVSGAGVGVVVATGARTQFGETASLVRGIRAPSDFQVNLSHFGTFLLRFGVLLALVVLVANTLLGRGLVPSFSLAVAVALGAIPEALPAVTATTLALGAARLARQKVLVRRLSAVEDLSTVDTLCIDKTGTLTENRTVLTELWTRLEPPALLEAAVLCATFPDPDNIVDEAVVAAAREKGLPLDRLAQVSRTTVAPFTAETKQMAVVAQREGSRQLLCKGAAGVVLRRCTRLRTPQGDVDLAPQRAEVDAALAAQQDAGARVLALAARDLGPAEAPDLAAPLVLLGLLGFSDPPRPGAREAVGAAQALHVRVKVVTGDALARAAALCQQIGLPAPAEAIVSAEALRGPDVAHVAAQGQIFADVVPADKFRLVRALQAHGAHVAMTGDGVNDVPALSVADVGITVASGSDAAKGAADLVLLESDLGVIVDGIAEGRRIFTRINRYLLYTMVSNFANVLIVALASLFLPFLPLLPSQVLLLNVLADLPMLAVASDRVAEDDIAAPRRWDVRRIFELSIYLGIINAIGAFALLRLLGDQPDTVVHAAWFLYLGVTALLVLFVVRTPGWAWQAPPPSWPLLLALTVAMAVTVAVPVLPVTQALFGLAPLTPAQWQLTGLCVAGYLAVAELALRAYHRASILPRPALLAPPRASS
jgi:Mg2+-importing ATPase